MSNAFAAAIEYHRSHETRWRRDFLTDDGRYIGVADEPAAVGDADVASVVGQEIST